MSSENRNFPNSFYHHEIMRTQALSNLSNFYIIPLLSFPALSSEIFNPKKTHFSTSMHQRCFSLHEFTRCHAIESMMANMKILIEFHFSNLSINPQQLIVIVQDELSYLLCSQRGEVNKAINNEWNVKVFSQHQFHSIDRDGTSQGLSLQHTVTTTNNIECCFMKIYGFTTGQCAFEITKKV